MLIVVLQLTGGVNSSSVGSLPAAEKETLREESPCQEQLDVLFLFSNCVRRRNELLYYVVLFSSNCTLLACRVVRATRAA